MDEVSNFSRDDIDAILTFRESRSVLFRGKPTRSRYAFADVAEMVEAEKRSQGNHAEARKLSLLASMLRSGNYPTKKYIRSLGSSMERIREIAGHPEVRT